MCSSDLLVHEQSIADVRRSHRITARLTDRLGQLPASVAPHATVAREDDGTVVIESADSITPLLGWLSTLPLDEVQIEPVGLDAVYERFHGRNKSG